MRFMVIVKGDKNSEAGKMPSPEMLNAMGKFNEELMKAGVLLAGEGLKPTSAGAKVRWSKGKPSVIDGPFTESKEIVAGFWLLQCRDKAEVVEWMKRCPCPTENGEGEIEIRPLFEMTDFAPGEWTEGEKKIREELDKKK